MSFSRHCAIILFKIIYPLTKLRGQVHMRN
jgi:hypothetical protein